VLKRVLIITFFCLLLINQALAQIPAKISFQGYLEDDGEPVNGLVNNIHIDIYDDLNGGTKYFDDDYDEVNVDNGFFTLILDIADHGIGDVAFDKAYYVEVTVNGTTLSPRQELTTAPYAMNAARLKSEAEGISLLFPVTSTVTVSHQYGLSSAIAGNINGNASTGIQGTVLSGSNSSGVAGFLLGTSAGQAGYFLVGPNATGYAGKFIGDVLVEGKISVDTSQSMGINSISTSGSGFGVRGESYYGVVGKGLYYGVYAEGDNAGVVGKAGISSATGVKGESTSGIGVKGQSTSGHAVYGESDEVAGIRGVTGNTTTNLNDLKNADGAGVMGSADSDTYGVGVFGMGEKGLYGYTSHNIGKGVYGYADPDDYDENLHVRAAGVYGYSNHGHGVVGKSGSWGGEIHNSYGGLFYGSNLRAIGAFGNVYIAGGSVQYSSLDVAEWIKVSDTSIQAGDVVIIDAADQKKIKKSNSPESRLVAGIISTDPGSVGGNQTVNGELVSAQEMTNRGYRMLSLCGQVPTKVTDESGPIKVGDLLTTSSTSGHAMRAVDPKIGTIVGKALEPLPSGQGKILVLLTLQ